MTTPLSEKENKFIRAIQLLYASNFEALSFHEYIFMKGEAIITRGITSSNNYEILLEGIREYLEKYKDSVFSFTIEKSDDGTLTTITLKD